MTRKTIRLFVTCDTAMPFDPSPSYFMPRGDELEFFPKIDVLDRLVAGCAPSAKLPSLDVLRDPFDYVLRVAIHDDIARSWKPV